MEVHLFFHFKIQYTVTEASDVLSLDWRLLEAAVHVCVCVSI